MSEKRFIISKNTGERFPTGIIDVERQTHLWVVEVVDLLNEQQATITALKEENEQLRLELETHKHPLWSTREAEQKLSEVTNSLANEVKRNGLLTEEINQLRIENMRLKKKGSDIV